MAAHMFDCVVAELFRNAAIATGTFAVDHAGPVLIVPAASVLVAMPILAPVCCSTCVAIICSLSTPGIAEPGAGGGVSGCVTIGVVAGAAGWGGRVGRAQLVTPITMVGMSNTVRRARRMAQS